MDSTVPTADVDSANEVSEFDLAVVGLSGRFPGASSIEEFWENLAAGVESITSFTDDELIAAGVPAHLVGDSNYVNKAPVLENAARFDAALFGYSPRDAQMMDPQQRQLLELAWAAMENAGYDPHRYEGRIATYAATAMNTYLLQSGLSEQFNDDYLPTLLGSDKDFQATRIAYKLGLTGPALSVQTACSSSLVALHLACQSLLSDECDMALVGAATVRAPLSVGHLYEEGSVFTPDGHCKPFDAAANGTIFGSGAAMVLVKRLTDAVTDRDTVWAVIRGSALNNDGDSKADYTAPSIGKQAEVISEAMGKAGVGADSISYVEAHGTGTYLGDPIELEALARAFRQDSQEKQYCAIGSVKSNIGHLDAAAGLVSLIKVVLAIKHRQLPPTLHFSAPNPQIDFDNSPFKVVTELQDWQPVAGNPRRAGVTSLGMGGTNAHVVLEEPTLAPAPDSAAPSQPQIITVSARTESALKANLAAIAAHCRTHPNLPIQDIAFTLRNGRQQLARRKAVAVSSATELAEVIESNPRGRIVSARVDLTERDVVLMFPGQGSQYPGMAKDLYDTEPVFRDVVDAVALAVQAEGIADLKAVMFASGEQAATDLAQTAVAQPALFAVQCAYAHLFQSWGIEPAALIGHSIGEYAAAVISGVFDLQAGARLVAARGRLMQAAPTGSMLAVSLPANKLADKLSDSKLGASLDLAVVNGVDSAVAAGPDDAIAALKQELEGAEIGVTVLNTSHAFHSAMMQSASDAFAQIAAQVSFFAPGIAFVSNVTGDWITDAQATDPAYWANHIRQPVRFSDGLATLFARRPSVLLETGPGTTLSALAQQHPDRGNKHAAMSAGRHLNAQGNDQAICLGAVGGLWTAGVDIDWAPFIVGDGRRVPLPTYAFEGDDHWYSAAGTGKQTVAGSNSGASVAPVLRRETDRGNWYWTEVFQSMPLPGVGISGSTANEQRLLLMGDATELSQSVYGALQTSGLLVTDSTNRFEGLRSRTDFESIVNRVDSDNLRPTDIVYCAPPRVGADHGERLLLELVHLTQVLSRWDGVHPCRLRVVTVNALAPIDEPTTDPYAAMLSATLKTISMEWPDVTTRLIDVSQHDDYSADSIATELTLQGKDTVVALRNGKRWVQTLASTWLNPGNEQIRANQQNCVVVGAFGGVGESVTRALARPGVRLGLFSRQPLPPREHWPSLGADDPEQLRVSCVQALENSGAQVDLLTADVADANAVRVALDAYEQRAGAPQQIFHLGGIVDDAPLYSKTDDSIASVLAPKLRGTQNLYDWIAERPDTKLTLFSSISAVMTPAGQVDYASANAFQQAFAATHPRVTSVAWPGWRNIGMASRIADAQLREHAVATGVDPDDAMHCLDSVIASGLPAVIVSPVSIPDTQRMNAAGIAPTIAASGLSASTSSDSGNQSTIGTTTADRVAGHFAGLLGFDPEQISRDESFFDLGGTSLVAVKLFARFEREFSVSLPVELLLSASTIDQLASEIDARLPDVPETESASSPVASANVESPVPNQSTEQKSLVLIRPGPTDRAPFYFVHAHGGMAIGYQDVVRRMQEPREIWGLQALGVRGDAKPLQTIEAMAARYIDEIVAANPTGPYLLGGYCMGGTIAWEMARQLEQAGRTVGLLVMIEAFHLDYPKYANQPNAIAKAGRVATDWFHAIGMRDSAGQAKIPFVAKTVWSVAVRQTKSQQERELEDAGGVPELIPVFRANGQAFFDYRPGEIHSPVIFLSAQHQHSGIIPDPTLGFGHLARGWQRAVSVPGSYRNGLTGLDLEHVVREMQTHFESDKLESDKAG